MKENSTLIAVVLDRSGSMSSVHGATIEGFNTFLTQQQKQPGETTMTFVQFDNVIETVYADKPIAEVPLLTAETYVPRNTTALLDAIGQTITAVGTKLAATPESERPSKVVFVIQTDGAENASQEYTRQAIFDMIEKQRNTYSWEFLFLGANQDAIATATAFGISTRSAITYNADTLSTHKVFGIASTYVSATRTNKTLDMDAVRNAVVDSNVTLDSFSAALDQAVVDSGTDNT